MLAGSEEAAFLVHKDKLCRTSDFFKRATSREWQRGEDKVVRVPAIEAPTFEVYSHWLYDGEVDLTRLDLVNAQADPTAEPDTRIDEVHHLLKLYVASDQLLDEQCRNAVIDELTSRSDDWPGNQLCIQPEHIEYIYANTSDNKLRFMFLDSFATMVDREKVESFDETRFSAEFFYDLAVRQMRLSHHSADEHRPRGRGRCIRYHAHAGPDWMAVREKCMAQEPPSSPEPSPEPAIRRQLIRRRHFI